MTDYSCTELLVRGDAAAAAGDHERLARIATFLSARVGDPLAGELVELARDCRRHTASARKAWPPLRRQIAHRVSIAGT